VQSALLVISGNYHIPATGKVDDFAGGANILSGRSLVSTSERKLA